MVEKCITIAKKGLAAEAAAEQFKAPAERGTDAWKGVAKRAEWKKWVPLVHRSSMLDDESSK